MQGLEHTAAGEPVAALPSRRSLPAGTPAVAEGRGVLESDRQEAGARG